MAAAGPVFHYKHLVVVHGIGDQRPNETALGFMNQFIRALPRTARQSVEVFNLIESVDEFTVKDAGSKPRRSFQPAWLEYSRDGAAPETHVIGFSEVYWQHITNRYLEQGDGPPVPIFTWARSVNARLLRPGAEYRRAQAAIDNIERLLGLARRLARLHDRLDAFTRIIDRFLGDVQMYAESDQIRHEINARFESVLRRVPGFADAAEARLRATHGPPAAFASREIYIVAHSEGTVIAFGSLVDAAAAPRPEARAWLPLVRGLVTLGSPLDKHYTIWRNRFQLRTLAASPLDRRIGWFNYWDRGDPVGFGLRTLFPGDPASPTDAERLFEVKHDAGFVRYFLPLLAHQGYWGDFAIHEDVIGRAMGLGTARAAPAAPADRGWAWLQKPAIVGGLWALLLASVGTGGWFVWKLAEPLRGGEWLAAKDVVGYLAGLVTAGTIAHVLWRVRRGLFQMWAYTEGEDTRVPVAPAAGSGATARTSAAQP